MNQTKGRLGVVGLIVAIIIILVSCSGTDNDNDTKQKLIPGTPVPVVTSPNDVSTRARGQLTQINQYRQCNRDRRWTIAAGFA